MDYKQLRRSSAQNEQLELDIKSVKDLNRFSKTAIPSAQNSDRSDTSSDDYKAYETQSLEEKADHQYLNGSNSSLMQIAPGKRDDELDNEGQEQDEQILCIGVPSSQFLL